jgi:hypothetical protein
MFPENKEGSADEVRRSLLIGSYETDGLWRQQGRSRTNQHHIYSTMLQLIMVMITIVIIIKLITTKDKEIQKARTSTEEKKLIQNFSLET